VTLTAHPDSNSHLDHWSACSGSAPTCKVTMSQARTVIAYFARTKYQLRVSKAGSGSGHVTSNYSGISCAPYCSHSYDSPTQVTLTATPGPESTFDGWSGDCSGTGTCRLTMNKAHSVTAKFTAHDKLSLSAAGDGHGTVASWPPGIDCPSTCLHTYDGNTPVSLHAHPDSSSHLDHWSGCTQRFVFVVCHLRIDPPASEVQRPRAA